MSIAELKALTIYTSPFYKEKKIKKPFLFTIIILQGEKEKKYKTYMYTYITTANKINHKRNKKTSFR